jgi:hypothetical protein
VRAADNGVDHDPTADLFQPAVVGKRGHCVKRPVGLRNYERN